jgi:hypothetical protein
MKSIRINNCCFTTFGLLVRFVRPFVFPIRKSGVDWKNAGFLLTDFGDSVRSLPVTGIGELDKSNDTLFAKRE